MSEKKGSLVSEKLERAPQAPTVIERDGFLRGSVVAVTGLSERLCEDGFALMRDARTETFTRLDGALEWVDGTQQSMMRFSRAALGHTDKALDAALEVAEAWLIGGLRVVRGVTLGAVEVGARAVMGKPEAPASIRAA
jgi:hypothetical protein